MWYSNMSKGRRGLFCGSVLVSIISGAYFVVQVASPSRYDMPMSASPPDESDYGLPIHGPRPSHPDRPIPRSDLSYLSAPPTPDSAPSPTSESPRPSIGHDSEIVLNGRLAEEDIIMIMKEVLNSSVNNQTKLRLLRDFLSNNLQETQVPDNSRANSLASAPGIAVIRQSVTSTPEKDTKPTDASLWSLVRAEVAFWTPLFVSLAGSGVACGTLLVQRRQLALNEKTAAKPKEQKPPALKSVKRLQA